VPEGCKRRAKHRRALAQQFREPNGEQQHNGNHREPAHPLQYERAVHSAYLFWVAFGHGCLLAKLTACFGFSLSLDPLPR
jgi:type VI protein secretion system component VasF